jgi:ribonuclease BN (tRNA processing enzyme)
MVKNHSGVLSNPTLGNALFSDGTISQLTCTSIVVSGDCAPSESIIEACNGCDVLVHEVYSTIGFARRPTEWQRYHSSFHTSSKELAEIATKAKPKLLVLYHQLLWGATKEQLLEEIAKGYSGKVVFGNDLDVY